MTAASAPDRWEGFGDVHGATNGLRRLAAIDPAQDPYDLLRGMLLSFWHLGSFLGAQTLRRNGSVSLRQVIPISLAWFSEATLYRWKRQYGAMEIDELKELKALLDENARLKRIVADQVLNIQGKEKGTGEFEGCCLFWGVWQSLCQRHSSFVAQLTKRISARLSGKSEFQRMTISASS